MRLQRRLFLILITIVLLGSTTIQAQLHEGLVDYAFNNTQTNGVKIKTNLPFTSGTQMPTIHIYGYNYRTAEPIDLSLVYYIYGNAFINYGITSTGGYTPVVKLANENGKVVIFIDDKAYFQRFTVSAYAKGMSAETAASFAGWTAVDEALTGTGVVTLPYKSKVAGALALPGGIWTAQGQLGIGTTTPKEALSVNGNIRAHEVKVETTNWPDYVFENNYPLPSLEALKASITKTGHLPGLPSATEVKAQGQNLGEVNKALVKKVEELTLYLLQQQAAIRQLQTAIEALKTGQSADRSSLHQENK